jgi:hypothetical protein
VRLRLPDSTSSDATTASGTTPGAASTETAMFRDASAALAGLGVPVIQIDTGVPGPQQAATVTGTLGPLAG